MQARPPVELVAAVRVELTSLAYETKLEPPPVYAALKLLVETGNFEIPTAALSRPCSASELRLSVLNEIKHLADRVQSVRIMLILILLVFAFVFFVLAGLGIPGAPRFNFIGWGLAFVTFAEILSRGPSLLH